MATKTPKEHALKKIQNLHASLTSLSTVLEAVPDETHSDVLLRRENERLKKEVQALKDAQHLAVKRLHQDFGLTYAEAGKLFNLSHTAMMRWEREAMKADR